MNKSPNGRGTAAERARYEWLHQLPCIVSGSHEVQVAHVRYPDSYFGKDVSGMGRKPNWVWTLPLSPFLHRAQHATNERDWWGSRGFNPDDVRLSPLTACLTIEGFRVLGDLGAATRWINARRNR